MFKLARWECTRGVYRFISNLEAKNHVVKKGLMGIKMPPRQVACVSLCIVSGFICPLTPEIPNIFESPRRSGHPSKGIFP